MTDTITYIIGNSHNAIRIPLLAFPTNEQAHDFLTSNDFIVEDNYVAEVLIKGNPVTLFKALRSGWGDENETDSFRLALFADGKYDDGNGEIGSLSIETIPLGKPVVGFDLD